MGLKPQFGLRPRNDLDHPTEAACRPVHQVADLRGICPEVLGALRLRLGPLQHVPCPIPIRLTGGMDHRGDDEPERIDERVSLASVQPFGAVL